MDEEEVSEPVSILVTVDEGAFRGLPRFTGEYSYGFGLVSRIGDEV